MKIDKIIGILSDYGSEKGFDFVISTVRELSKKRILKEHIDELIRKELSVFENTGKNGEYDFQGLIDLLKEFDNESFIESYIYAYFEHDSLENKKELIRKECIRDTNANTQESEESVRRIIDRCFSIVETHIESLLSKEQRIQVGIIIQAYKEVSNQNADSIKKELQDLKNELNESFAALASPSIQPECDSPTNDNQAYLDAFSNPLFLEDEEKDKNVISLADMYISPSIKNQDVKASDCIIKWYRDSKTKPCMLLYGNAGVGKSSFVSKILADANGITEKSNVEFDLEKDKILTVSLRNHTDVFNNDIPVDEVLINLFSCNSIDQLKNKLIILDGLDELCVMNRRFNGKSFLEDLSQLEYGFHILITSRESDSYFSHPCNEDGIKIERLLWEEEQVKNWLDFYSNKKPDKAKWCEEFLKQLGSIKPNDTRHEIFCIPIILYICGTSELNLVDHKNVGSIYKDAFCRILLRKHIRGQKGQPALNKKDKEETITNWQYTKELAYQMFLIDSLDLIDDENSDELESVAFRNAQSQTRKILKIKYNISAPKLDLKKELAVCPFAKEKGSRGITFAHKSVYEYFTAVKLYEDYFVRFDTSFFKKTEKNKAAKKVFRCIIQAFRYDIITKEIFDYLCDMQGAPFGCDNTNGLDYEQFEEAFMYGMKEKMYTKIGISDIIEEYFYPVIKSQPFYYVIPKTMNVQYSTAFSNLSWFLSGHGFSNQKNSMVFKEIGKILESSYCKVCFHNWSLPFSNFKDNTLIGSDFTYAHLRSSIFSNANLEFSDISNADLMCSNLTNTNLSDTDMIGVNLTNANLSKANMYKADLRGAIMKGANLREAYLVEADLTTANLSNADLTGAVFEDANLSDVNMKGAKYCKDPLCQTIFPKDFRPQGHQMLEVDIDGFPV